jgi:hypothetical protein
MAAPTRRLSDQEIRSVLLQAHARGQSRSFNDVLSYWGEAVGWHGYEADIARARVIFEEGPEAWTHAEPPPTPRAPEPSPRSEAPRAGPVVAPPPTPPARTEPPAPPAPPPAQVWSGEAPRASAPTRAPESRESAALEPLFGSAAIPSQVWIPLGALGLAVAAGILYRLLRRR